MSIFLIGIFLVAFIFGFLIRIEGFITGNILFLYDNARDLLYVHKIVIDKDPILIGPSSGGLQGYFHGVFWYYLLTIPFIIGKGNPVYMTGFMVFSSCVSILTVFFIFKKISTIYTAAFIGIIWSLASFSVDTTRFIWNPYPIVWLMPLYFFFLYTFSQQKRYAFPALAFLTSLFIHFEAIYGICLLPTLVVTFVIEVRRFLKKKDFVPIIAGIFLFFIPIAPSILFDLRHDFLISKSLLSALFSGGQSLSHSASETETIFTTRIISRGIDLYNFTIQSVTPNAWINIVLFLSGVYGFILLVRNKKSHLQIFVYLSLLAVISPFFVFLLLKYAVWSYYWIGTSPLYTCFLIFLIGIVIEHKKKQPFMWALLLVLLVFIYRPIEHLKQYFSVYVSPGYNNLQTQLAIVKTIQSDAKNESYSVYNFTPPVYDYVYRYLFLWKHTTEQTMLPKDEKQKIIYLILEPSPSDLDGMFFKKNTIKTVSIPDKVFQFSNVRVEKIRTAPGEENIDMRFLPNVE